MGTNQCCRGVIEAALVLGTNVERRGGASPSGSTTFGRVTEQQCAVLEPRGQPIGCGGAIPSPSAIFTAKPKADSDCNPRVGRKTVQTRTRPISVL